MTSSKITAMATLALALVLIGSVITGHLFVVNALLPNTPVVASQKTTTTTIAAATTQTSSFDPARVLVQDAIIALQNSDNNKALVHLKLADQQLAALPNGGNSPSIQPIRTLLEDAVHALVQNSDNNKALVHLKLADQQLSTATSENTVSPNAGSESSKVLMTTVPSKNTGAVAIVPSTTSIYNLILDGKTYPIKYQITGESNKLNYMTTKADKAAILANVTSQSTGKLIIELPRILLESKKGGTVTDIPYVVFGDGQYKVANEIKNNNNVQVRTLAIEFNKGTKQIEIDGSKIGTQPIPSTVSSSTLDHNPLSSSPVYIHKTTDINKNKIIVTTPQDSKKSKSKDPSLPYYDPNFPDKPANMPFCSQPKANANHKVCYDESDNPHPPCTKYPDNPACGTGKNVAGQGQPVKSCNSSQDSNQCITSIPQPKNLNPSGINQPKQDPVDSACDKYQSFHPYIAAICTGWKIGEEIFPPQPSTENEPIQQSSPIPGLLPSPTSDSPDNSVSPTDKSESSKRAEIDARKDTQGSNGHGYDSSCPSGHSAGFCGNYKKVYDNVWKDLHSSSP